MPADLSDALLSTEHPPDPRTFAPMERRPNGPGVRLDAEGAPWLDGGPASPPLAADVDPWAGLFVPVGERPGWLREVPPAPQWAIRQSGEDSTGVLERGTTGILAASGGTGKTWALLELAMLAAAGGTGAHGCYWMERFWVAGGPVAMLAAEESPNVLWRRLDRIWRRWRRDRPGFRRGDGYLDHCHDLILRRLVAVPGAGHPELALMGPGLERGEVDTSAAGWKLLAALQEPPDGVGWAFVVADPLARVAGVEVETSQHAATRAVQILERMGGAPGTPAVLVAHHMSQAGKSADLDDDDEVDASGIRGVTGLVDAARFAATLRPLPRLADAPHLIRLRNPKNNMAPRFPAVTLTNDRGVLRAATHDEIEEYQAARAKADRERAAEKERRKPGATGARERALAAACGVEDDE